MEAIGKPAKLKLIGPEEQDICSLGKVTKKPSMENA